ncbi:MAG TPA: substrate-binding domain-containing protein [Vicinamibacterales bacterium]|nr:substrate-binding domain-containing protein [Vicinamibacterales bacterium]
MLKRLLPVALVAVTIGCGGPGKPGRPVVGVTLLTEQHAFYKTLEDGLREEAKAKNLDLVIVACEMDPAKQAAQIEDFVARHVAALLVAPCDSSAVAENLASADAAGIPVFTADIAAHGAKVVSHVASDNVQGGRLAARALAQFIGDKGDVAIIDQPTVASVQERVRGFDEEMRNHPNIHIVARPGADGQRARAMAAMEDMLQAHPDLAGVFGINDDSALGALSVVEAAGRKNIAIVGYDATDEAKSAIARGSALKADVAQDPGQIGRTAIDMIAQHLAGQQVPPIVAVKVGLVTADTLKK